MGVQTTIIKIDPGTLAEDELSMVLFYNFDYAATPQTSQNTFRIIKQNAQVRQRKSTLQGFFYH